ncbi:MAG TPA: peptidase S24, partial [Xanthomarina gelatinilytica]|nr:peptidase S24 [Xanthomarina gelatinilytica]
MQVRKLYNTPTITFFQADVSSELELPYVVNGISA